MTGVALSLLFSHLSKRAYKNGRVKRKIFRKSSLSFTYGQEDCRKSDLDRPNSNKDYSRNFPRLEIYLRAILPEVSAVAVIQYQQQTQEFCHI